MSKLSSNGDFVWAKSMGGTDSDSASGIALDIAGNVYTTGNFSGTVDFNPHPTSVFNLTSAGGYDVFVSKLSSNGDFVWAKSMGSTSRDLASGIALDTAGNVYTTGFFFGTADFNPHPTKVFNLASAGSCDVFVNKLSSNGDFVWSKSMGGTDDDESGGIALDNAGNVYTTGFFFGTADFNPHPTSASNLKVAGQRDIFVSKLSQAFLNGAGTAQNGYLVGSTAFFDASFNGVLDPSEPSALTDSTGDFAVEVPLSFDTNTNGLLDDTEGQWVVFGGTDSSTGLPAVNKLISPASWSAVTPLTTLVATLVANHGYTVNGAMSRVKEALGLPAVDLSDLVPIASTLAGDPNAPQVFAAHARIQDTISQALAVFAGVGSPPVGVDFSRVLMAEIASLIAVPATTPDFSDIATIEQLLHNVETTSGVALNADVLSGASSVIAETNQLIDDVTVANNIDFLNQISQIKRVSQGAVASQLKAASQGDVAISAVVATNTGTGLTNQVAAAATPPTLILPANIVAEATGAAGAEVSFIVSATNLAGQSVPFVLNHNPGDLFAFGTTTVTVSASGSGLTSNGSFTVTVADTVGPQFETVKDIVVKSNAPGGAIVTLDNPTAIDLVDFNPSIVWDAASGFFPLGTTTVTGTATDATGNSTIVQFLVIVTAANDAPAEVNLENVISTLPENSSTSSRIIVADIMITDDAVGTNTLSLSGADAQSFEIVGTQLFLKAGITLDFETRSSFDVTVSVDDSTVGLTPDAQVGHTLELSNVTEFSSLLVQDGQTQRSYLRYLDIVFDQSEGIQAMINSGRFQLTKYDVFGNNPTNVPLTSSMFSLNRNIARLDFGAQGVGGNRNTNVGDGYYQLEVDTNNDLLFESSAAFHRLLGDLTGDGQVDNSDKSQLLRRSGPLAENDVNGDGLLNLSDTSLLSRAFGRRIWLYFVS